jgi:hypothetical protein
VQTSIGGGNVTSTSGQISLKSRLNANEDGSSSGANQGASATSGAVAAALLGGISGAISDANENAVVNTFVGGGTLSAGGAITLLSASYVAPVARSRGFGGGLVGIGITDADATAKGSIRTHMDGGVSSAGSMSVTTLSTVHVTAESKAVSGGIVSGNAAVAHAEITKNGSGDPSALASLGSGNVTVSGNINVISVLTSSADATGKGLALGAIAAGGSVPTALMTPLVVASIAGGTVASTAGTINLISRFNTTADGLFTGDVASADAQASSGGLIAASGGVSYSDASPEVETKVSGGTLRAGQDIVIRALSNSRAFAKSRGIAGGLAGVGVSVAKAYSNGTTKAHLDGQVTNGSNSGAANLTVEAVSGDTANAIAQAVTGGLLAGSFNYSEVGIQPTTTAYISSTGAIRTSANAKVLATEFAEADAITKGVSAGLLALGGSQSKATVQPDVTSYLLAATVDAGSILVNASAKSPDGNAPTYIVETTDTVNDVIHVTNHGLSTGDTVLIGSREYNVIPTGPNDLTLGSIFPGAAFNPANPQDGGIDGLRDTIHFQGPHNFVTGDRVVYLLGAGGSSAGDLTPSSLYYVLVIDGTTIKLTTYNPLVVTDLNLKSFTPDNDTIDINLHGFTNGLAVTYHAPAAKTFSSLQVDVNGGVNGQGVAELTNNIFANNIQFVDTAEGPNEGHPVFGFALNDIVRYTANGTEIGGLHSGTNYKVSEVSGTNNSIIKLHALQSVSVTFHENNPPASNRDTITRTSGSWLDDGFRIGQTITITNTLFNNGTYTLDDVSALTLTLILANDLAPEGPVLATIESSNIALDPGDKNNRSLTGVVHSLIKVSDLPLVANMGVGNMDGKTFYVRDAAPNSFKLAAFSGGPALTLTAQAGATNNHKIGPESVDVEPASGQQILRIDLTSSLNGTTLLAPGGVPLNVVSPPVDDGVSSATSNGSGVGVVAGQVNSSVIDDNPNVKAYISSGGLVRATNDVTIVGDSTTKSTASAKNGTGGLIGVGGASTTSNQNTADHKTEVYVDTGTRIIAGGNVTVQAKTQNNTTATSSATTGGLVGVAIADTDSTISYSTTATVKTGADILAGNQIRILADSRTSQSAAATASGLGFGGDGNATSTADTSSGLTQAQVANAALVNGRSVIVAATVSQMFVRSTADGRGAGFVAVGTADAGIDIHANNKVLVDANAQVSGYEGVDFRTRFYAVDTLAHSFARATGLFGHISSDANNSTHMDSVVNSAGGALITAGPRDLGITGAWDSADPKLANIAALNHLALYVDLSNGSNVNAEHTSDSSRRSLATGGDNADGHGELPTMAVDFDSNVLILSGRSPELIVEENGTISKAVNVSVNDIAGSNSTRTSGLIVDTTIHVNGINNADPGQVYFSTGGSSSGSITGSGGTWTFRDTFEKVRIVNKSKKNLEMNAVKVVNTTVDPIVDLTNTDTLTLTFAIFRVVAPTLTTIDNTNPDPPDVIINGIIENPIGITRIVVVNGNILSSASRVNGDADPTALIRTNILDLETPSGSIGQSSPRVNVDVVDSANVPAPTTFITAHVSDVDDRIYLGPLHQFFTGELVKYSGSPNLTGLVNNHYYYVIVSSDGLSIQLADISAPSTPIPIGPTASLADSHTLTPAQRFTVIAKGVVANGEGYAYLDIKGRLRSAALPYSVIIDAVSTDADTNFLLRGSVQETTVTISISGTAAGFAAGILVKYDAHPSGKIFYTAFDSEGVTHGPPLDLGMFAGSPVHIDSTYDIRAFDSAGVKNRPGITSKRNIIIAAAEPFAASPKLIHIFGITEIVGTGFVEGPSDVHHIDILTNGNITINEITDDLRVGDITSTSHDVLLYAPLAIVDALDDPNGTDVSGENITLVAGTGLQLNGTISNPMPLDVDRAYGNIGRPGNFLEINVDIIPTAPVDPALGVLRAFDTTAVKNYGIFLDEMTGNMNVHTIWTVGDDFLDTGNVTLRSRAGSIVDGRANGAGDEAADVLAQTVDIDAHGGSIGDPSGNNDLDIDSRRASPAAGLETISDDVALEAQNSIFVTETDSHLRLVLAHARTGNIRLTVRESSPLDVDFTDEDFFLIKDGSARFAERDGTAPTSGDVDAPRTFLHGQVFAEMGYVVIRVGDDVELHQNSEIVADLSIDIFGDFGNSDTGNNNTNYGTTMILRGRIVADAVVTLGDLTGDPAGTYVPSANNPVAGRITNIWGNADVDTFQFGDPSGEDLVPAGSKTTWGNPGYIFIGSKTRVHGSQDADSTGDDGEDQFIIYYLQSADVVGSPADLATDDGAGHSLTLDGQADTDYYTIYTTGSHGSIRNYVINILDTGDENDGVDEATIFGYDNLADGFNGYIPGTLTKAKTDDIFLLRAVKAIDTESPFNASDPDLGVPTTATGTEVADHPAFVVLLHGDESPDGGLSGYRSRAVGDEVSKFVQRINYDAALNGRLSVYGKGGNDYFAVDDNSAITTLDGGFGNDTFAIGQIFGFKRDTEEGALLGSDTFPVLIATTRGWLSPGTHAPLVATGGRGNDEFTVYSNQAELRLEGDDDNDLFVVRAFALAAVVDTDANSDGVLDLKDVEDPFGIDTNHNGFADAGDESLDPLHPLITTIGHRRTDNNGDGVFNAADAHKTPLNIKDDDHTKWEDDIIPLDADGVARPIIGLGFSTARPLDIRAGGGEDEVSYNVNAPVSVDGGTGFDKLVVLGTEFADDIVISVKGIFGAGLNVRYDNIEVVEVDGLEGDDEFFVQSTKFGVAYRVIGGLGSDTINVTGDVTEDIVTRELEGVSGTIDHRLSSAIDAAYDGLPVDGLDYNLATSDIGQVIIGDEGPEGTSVREGGSVSVPSFDFYSITLAADPGFNVYVTVSAARSPQEEADNTFSNPEPTPTSNSLTDGPADTIWLAVGPAPVGGVIPAALQDPANYRRYKWVNGVYVDENNRALVLTFIPGGAGGPLNWKEKQWVYVYAVDDPPGPFIDARSEGDRVVVIQHSTISENPKFDQVAVRNVEVSVRDNDTPGVYVTKVTPGTFDEDKRTLVLEGDLFDPLLDKVPHSDPIGGHADVYTGRTDELLVQLQKDPGPATIRVKLVLDAKSQQAIQLDSLDTRWNRWKRDAIDGLSDPFFQDPMHWFTYYTIDFDTTNWETPVRITVKARPDAKWEDPQTAVISFIRDDLKSTNLYVLNPVDGTVDIAKSDIDNGKTNDPAPGERYVFPNLRSGNALSDVEVIDDETADLISIESGVDTVVRKFGDDFGHIPGLSDDYTIRLTKQPEKVNDSTHSVEPVTVDVAILADGMVDVSSINGVAVTPANYQVIGGLIPSQLFFGNISISADGLTVTRANGSELGSFIDEGFEPGDLIRFKIGASTYDREISEEDGALTDLTMTLKTALPGGPSNPKDVAISYLTREGDWTGLVTVVPSVPNASPIPDTGWQLVRNNSSSWLGDGFLEGQWVEISIVNNAFAPIRVKVQLIRGNNKTKDEKLEFRYRNDDPPAPAYLFQDDLSGLKTALEAIADPSQRLVRVRRIAAVAHFNDDNWFAEQKIVLTADVNYSVPISRDGVKVFPVSTHKLSKLRGPLAVEGGVSGADRSLQLGLKLPGEKDGPLFAIGKQPPESKQIDVLNIFNDGSQEDRIGTMTSTTLSGLGLPDDLNFGPTYSSGNPQTFGEPAIFPGGIGYGTVQFVDGKFSTNGAKSTVEVVNVLLGSGNDTLDVQGTLDPDVAVKLTGTIIITPVSVPHAPGGHTGIDLTRPQPFDWKAQGFLVGQPVHISGFDNQVWIVTGFSDDDPLDTQDNTRMHLSGPILTQAQIDAAPYDVFLSKLVSAVTVVGGATGGTVTRASGNWINDGFIVGQRIQLNGVSGTWRLQAITNGDKTLVLDQGGLLPSAVSSPRTISSVVRTVTADDIPVLATVPITIVGGAFGGTVTRHDVGGSWTADKFEPGQLVMIQGLEGSWRLIDISLDGQTLTLDRGDVLPTIASQELRMVFWPGPHGGLTVIHGGGNTPLQINFQMDTAANSVTRRDGLSWIDAGYSIGQKIQIAGAGSKTFTITGFGIANLNLPDPFPGAGLNSVMLLSPNVSNGTVPVSTNVKRSVHVAEPEKVETTALLNITVQNPGPGLPTSTLTATNGQTPFDDAALSGTVFKAGMQVWISGIAGPFTIVSVTPTVMVLQGAALTPTYAIVNDVTVFTPILLTVFGYDVNFDGGVRMGGDRITIANPDNPIQPGPVLGGPNSPLVVYGDTSQDGIWYGGHSFDVKGYEFGPKPYDPFWKIPDGENEDDEWVFPLADRFNFAGNDIIDASHLFEATSEVNLPSVGFTAYGGGGNDLIIGSQAGDHLAGGSGNDTILGLRGVDHIYGDSGFNVNILTRGLIVSTINASPRPTLDNRNPGGDQTIKPVPSQNADLMLAGRDLIYGEGSLTYMVGKTLHSVTTVLGGKQEVYDDVIAGDHMAVIQQTADPNTPDTRLQKIQTTLIASIRFIESRAYQNGEDDVIFGNLGRDVILGGAGDDMIDGNEADDMIFGDNAFMGRRVIEPQYPAATNYTGTTNTTSARFQTLAGTLIYSRSDRPIPDGFDPATSDTSGVLLVNGVRALIAIRTARRCSTLIPGGPNI